jgi:hypothetical protein
MAPLLLRALLPLPGGRGSDGFRAPSSRDFTPADSCQCAALTPARCAALLLVVRCGRVRLSGGNARIQARGTVGGLKLGR